MKEITLSNNKKIKVFDELFTYRDRCNMFSLMRKIPFNFWAAYDTLITDQESSFIIKSAWDNEHFGHFGLMQLPEAEPLRKELHGYALHRSWVNLGTPIDRLRYHSDSTKPGERSMLYYLNVHWDINWDAPTLFSNEQMTEVEYACSFRPGRVVIFDSDVPHKATHAPAEAKQFRFTLNSTWRPIE
jgi:hypothetical protein